MMKKLTGLFCFIVILCLTGCSFSPGSFEFPTKEQSLFPDKKPDNSSVLASSMSETDSSSGFGISADSVLTPIQSSDSDPDFIDRVLLPEYAASFYQSLVEASDNDGDNDWLIDVTKGELLSDHLYAIQVAELSGTAADLEEAKAQVNEKGSLIYQTIQTAYDAFTMDHPEVFWLSGDTYCATNVVFDGKNYTAQISFVLRDTQSGSDIRSAGYQDPDRIRSDIGLLDAAAADITASVNGSAAEIVRGFSRYLTSHNGYNTLLTENYPEASSRSLCALTGNFGETGPVCEAYSKALKVLCDRSGIPCVLARGRSVSGDGTVGLHAWNYVQIEGNWYAMDVTWNDPLLNGADTEGITDYELVGAETVIQGFAFAESHQEWNQVSKDGWVFDNGPKPSPTAFGNN